MEFIVHYFSFRHELFVDHIKKVIGVVLTLRFASNGPWWWFCSPLYTLIDLDGVLTRCNSVSLLLIHEICVEATLHTSSTFASLHEESDGIVSHSMCSGYLINFMVIWWSPAASLWTIATVYRFWATDSWSRLGSSSRFQGTFSVNLVNHSESYVQDRAFLYTILTVMFANVAVSQG